MCSIMRSRVQSLAWKIWEIINKLFVYFFFFLSSGTASEESVLIDLFFPRARWMPVMSYWSGGAPVYVGWSLKHLPQSVACRVSRSEEAFRATGSRSSVDWFWHPPHNLFWSHILFVSRDRTNMQWEPLIAVWWYGAWQASLKQEGTDGPRRWWWGDFTVSVEQGEVRKVWLWLRGERWWVIHLVFHSGWG